MEGRSPGTSMPQSRMSLINSFDTVVGTQLASVKFAASLPYDAA